MSELNYISTYLGDIWLDVKYDVVPAADQLTDVVIFIPGDCLDSADDVAQSRAELHRLL